MISKRFSIGIGLLAICLVFLIHTRLLADGGDVYYYPGTAVVKSDMDGDQIWSEYREGYSSRGLHVDGSKNIYFLSENIDANLLRLEMLDPTGKKIWGLAIPEKKIQTSSGAFALVPDGGAFAACTLSDADPALVTQKIDEQGNRKWETTYTKPGVETFIVKDVQTDTTGNVYVLGMADSDILILKYQPGGEFLWEYCYDYLNKQDTPIQMILDADSNLYVCGLSIGDDDTRHPTLLKFDQNGNRVWFKRLIMPVFLKDDSLFDPVRMTGEGADKIVLATAVREIDEEGKKNHNLFLIAYLADGQQLWEKRIDLDTADQLVEIQANPEGDIFLLGYSAHSTNSARKACMLRLDAQGNLYNLASDYEIDRLFPRLMKLDSQGRIYLAGMNYSSTSYYGSYSLLCLNDKFELIWDQSFSSYSWESEEITSLVIDDEGSIYFSGETIREEFHDYYGGDTYPGDDDDEDKKDDHGCGVAIDPRHSSAALTGILVAVGILAMALGCRRKK